MTPLKEAIAEKHTQIEKMPFNQKMFKGELNNKEYILYLIQQFAIYNKIEKFPLLHPSLNRSVAVLTDIKELLGVTEDEVIEIKPLESTTNYLEYLDKLSMEELYPHIYLNYFAIIFGGQMMKSKVPGSGKMYEFDGDMKEIIGSIRTIQKDEWADEANKALDFNMDILKQLDNTLNAGDDLKTKIIYYSDKFKQLIEKQNGVKLLDTEDFGWENYRYESPKFRLAHIERYFHDNLLVLHITCFPRETDSSPIFGFDVVCSEKTQKISGAFLDLSPVLFDKQFHNSVWNSDRKLPYWATIFSKYFIAVRPTEDEHDKLFELAFEIFEKFLNDLNSDIYKVENETYINKIIEKQNEYCIHQAKNERTFGALKTKIGEEKARYFMTKILFPEIKI